MIKILGWSIRTPSSFARLVVAGALSAALISLDHQGQHLERIRAGLTVLMYPLQLAATLPSRTAGAFANFFQDERALRETNERLRAERELLLARLQQLEALEAENARLRQMLGSAARTAGKALAADIFEVSPEPFTRRIIVTRGSRDNVYVGQPVIDAYGVVGQVTRVAARQSQVTLITDPGHAIPVLVNRSGVRAIAFGTGDADSLRVPHLTAGADIREGDLLVSSGMGGTFPANYPVARVTHVSHDPDEAFLDIRAKPVAQLNHSQRTLLIWPADRPMSAESTGTPGRAKAGAPPPGLSRTGEAQR